jgi:RecA-family ATPase
MEDIRNNALGPQPTAHRSLLHVPLSLRELAQWCIAGSDKRPLASDGRAASVTDPTTWTDFETASRVAAACGSFPGFVLRAGDPFTCIDLDVKDDTAPEQLQRFESIVATFDSYTERSRSGRGWHIWIEGGIGKGRRRDGVEVYSQERFIICTGDIVRDRPIAERQELLNNLVSQMPAPPSAVALELAGDACADLALAERASMDAGELGRLFRGDWQGRYTSQSEADLALNKLLMPFTDSPRECWLTFLHSKLGEREKARRADYARSTMALAAQHLANDTAHVAHGRMIATSLAHNPRHFLMLRDGELDQLPKLRWLVKRIIPDAGIGAIYGDSGTFKSFLTLDALAHISNGQEWFGHRVMAAPAVYVPFEGQGGVPNRIKAWRLAQAAQRNPDVLFSVVPPDDIRSNVAVVMDPMNLREQADRDKLVATLTENGWAGGVLCIDTLAHASNGIDENSSAMGEMLTIFRELQHRLGGVILIIHHSGKDQTRGMRGWSGLHAAMDFVVECQHDKDAGHRDAQFVLTKVKDGASGVTYGFTMQSVPLGYDEDGDPITSLTVIEKGPANLAALALKPDAERDEDDDQFVWEWVRREVERGEYPSGRSLEGQREKQMSQEHSMTQKRFRDAVHRLRASSRLVDADEKAPSGNVYLIAV